MEKREWFEEWFGTPYCRMLYKGRDEMEADLFTQNIVQLLNPHQKSLILDVACGSGRHAEAISPYAQEVIGIDINLDCITAAQLREKENLSFFKHDMRRIFRINYFDIVLSLFTSFGYFDRTEDEKKAAYSLAANIKPGGFLVFDYLNERKLRDRLVLREELMTDGIHFNLNRRIEGNRIIKKIEIQDLTGTHQFEERVWLYSLKEIKDLFSRYGLRMIYTFGDYYLQDYHPDHSDRLIAVFQKNQTT